MTPASGRPRAPPTPGIALIRAMPATACSLGRTTPIRLVLGGALDDPLPRLDTMLATLSRGVPPVT
ncbi:hypothetical protein ACQP2X_26685 [Actinoplanes sp. CA-131856]